MPKRFRIGYRTLKTAVAASLAISLAQWLQMDQYATAGILAILSIQVTQKRSLVFAGIRFISCLLGMFFAFLFFEGLSYHPLMLGLLLLVFIPTLVTFKLETGMITSAVVITHLYTLKGMTLSVIMSEIGVIALGIGMALIVNLYMPNIERELKRCRHEVEQNFTRIFSEFAIYLREGDHLWDGREFTIADQLIQKGKKLASRDVENHFLRHEDENDHYFQMREKQFDILERLLPIVSSLPHTVEQGEQIAQFLDEVGEAVQGGNRGRLHLDKLQELREEFREMPLPQTRSEFEVRASLFHLLNEMEQYLLIKRQFYIE